MNRQELRLEVITRYIGNVRAGRKISCPELLEEILKGLGQQLSAEEKNHIISEIYDRFDTIKEYVKQLRFKAAGNLRVDSAPGFTLRRIAEFLFSPKAFHEIFEPTLRDLLDEYCAALGDKHAWKARWVRIRGYWSFWSAVFAQLPISTVKMVYKIWKATR